MEIMERTKEFQSVVAALMEVSYDQYLMLVSADWFEEHGYTHVASELRQGINRFFGEAMERQFPDGLVEIGLDDKGRLVWSVDGKKKKRMKRGVVWSEALMSAETAAEFRLKITKPAEYFYFNSWCNK